MKQYRDPFARSCKYLSVGVCLLFAVAKGPDVYTDSPRALFLIDVCPGHFALIARESRRNDCRTSRSAREMRLGCCWHAPRSRVFSTSRLSCKIQSNSFLFSSSYRRWSVVKTYGFRTLKLGNLRRSRGTCSRIDLTMLSIYCRTYAARKNDLEYFWSS